MYNPDFIIKVYKLSLSTAIVQQLNNATGTN